MRISGRCIKIFLTTPSSECYWDLDHAGRWNQNAMYVVAMAAKRCKTIYDFRAVESNNGISDTFIKKLKTMDNDNQLKNSNQRYDEEQKSNLRSGIVAKIWKVRN